MSGYSRGNDGFGDLANLPWDLPSPHSEESDSDNTDCEENPWDDTTSQCARIHNVQVRKMVLKDGNTHWHLTPYSKLNADYPEIQKQRNSPEWNARRTVLHARCPPWCPNCGGCGARSTFPGCGRTVLPEEEEEQLRIVTEKLLNIRREIQHFAKVKARAKAKMEAAKKALKDSEEALKDAAEEAYKICWEAYSSASQEFNAKAAEYKTLYDKNWHMGQGTHFGRNRPPR